MFLDLFQSAKVDMTCLSVNSDLFMSMDYFASFPSVPVSPILSEPAKSTSSMRLLSTPLLGLRWSKLSTLTLKMLWLREEVILSLCAELILFFNP